MGAHARREGKSAVQESIIKYLEVISAGERQDDDPVIADGK